MGYKKNETLENHVALEEIISSIINKTDDSEAGVWKWLWVKRNSEVWRRFGFGEIYIFRVAEL